MGAELEVGPERFEEVASGIQRNAAYNVADCDAEEHGEQNAGSAEHEIKEGLPNLVLHMGTEFDPDSTQDEQPENHHQREIEAAEAGGVELRKREVEGATGGQKPDFVAVPDGADGSENAAALFVSLGDSKVDRTGAQVETVEHDVRGDCDDDNPVPEGRHIQLAFVGTKAPVHFLMQT